MRKVLIVAATSAIAEAFARRCAERGDALYLLARDTEHLARVALDLATRGAARVETAQLDVIEHDRYAEVFDFAWTSMESFDVLLLAHGVGTDERRARDEPAYLRQQFAINATAMLALMNHLGGRLARQESGTLAVLSSVAGDRGRGANLVYGSAKAAVSAYADGLRQRLHRHGVRVLTIKPGWVDTPLTAHMQKSALFATPGQIARGIERAIDHGRSVVYLPWFWRPIMAILRHIPASLWNRLSF